ncbi:MAG: cobalamin-dependent protein [Planctomycetota bacterium]|nr:cobalamin-dependent protein [Planctomycetota bacterium]MDA1105056.1 cobalamin-dependent protein [Planctomycetota bacterium]
MNTEHAIERLFNTLLTGDRQAARQFCLSLRTGGITCEEISHNVYWPILSMLYQQRKSDQISTLAFNYATRLMRSIVDGWRAGYTHGPRNGKTVLVYAGEGEVEDMSAQLVADLVESAGWTVQFAGGGIASDEIINEAGTLRPDALVVWAPLGANVPAIRDLIDTLRTRGAYSDMPVICGGGIFCRAEGLATEIGADANATTPGALLHELEHINTAAVANRRTNTALPTNAARRQRIQQQRAAA